LSAQQQTSPNQQDHADADAQRPEREADDSKDNQTGEDEQ
jgi:hypothetical protein